MYKRILFVVTFIVAMAGSGAVAQEATTVETMDDPDLGTYLVDPEGMTLYIFLNDEPDSGESACYDQCEENWPVFSGEEPLSLPEGVSGELGTIERTDGTMQVTYNGWPLYYWAQDSEPGDVTGQGVGDVWFVAVPTEGDAIPGADVPEASPMASPAASPMAMGDTTVVTAEDMTLGTIFTDAEGMTLYIFLSDTPNSGESTCYDQCEENWPVFSAEEPLTLPDGVPGELGTIERTDGTMQVTYNGWPLYYWAADQAPGDVTGQGVGDVWYVAIPVEGDEVPGADMPAASAEVNQVEVMLTEFEIRMPTEIPSGQTEFVISNTGGFPHNFEIEGNGIEMELEADLQGGESATLVVDLQPGEYEIYCPVGSHAEQGMELTLTVTD